MVNKEYGQLFEITDVDREKLSRIINDKKLLLLSGPSGVGKSTITECLLERNSNLGKIKRFTTKKEPVKSSLDTYFYVQSNIFSSMMQNNEFFEVGRFGPGFYGTTYNSLDDLYNANVDIAILEADLETISFIKRLCQKPKSQILSVFLTPIESESFELDNVYIDRAISVLENRIISRCRGEEQRDIKGRLKGAKKMFLTMNQADYVIVNKDGSLEETLEQLYKIL